jgi:PAS domain S-box-containing protein
MRSTAETILEHIDQGAVTASPEGIITYANERFAAMAGAARRSLLGTPLARLVRHPEEERLLDTLRACAARGAAAGRITFHRNHSSLRVRVSAAPLADGALWLFTDLREQTQRESSDRRLREFVGSLGEEFRSLIAPIRRSLEAVRDEAAGDAARRELAAIEAGTQRLLELAERMARAGGEG